jgi:hypothetical protein
VRHAVAGDGIEGSGDVGALQARQSDVEERIFATLIGKPDHLEQVAMAFHDYRLFVNSRSLRAHHRRSFSVSGMRVRRSRVVTMSPIGNLDAADNPDIPM